MRGFLVDITAAIGRCIKARVSDKSPRLITWEIVVAVLCTLGALAVIYSVVAP
jgi:hypothetical protein